VYRQLRFCWTAKLPSRQLEIFMCFLMLKRLVSRYRRNGNREETNEVVSTGLRVYCRYTSNLLVQNLCFSVNLDEYLEPIISTLMRHCELILITAHTSQWLKYKYHVISISPVKIRDPSRASQSYTSKIPQKLYLPSQPTIRHNGIRVESSRSHVGSNPPPGPIGSAIE
jgi:hypothetical protein